MFRIVKARQTRLGDFRVFPDGHTQITVNNNLNLYAFLITYVHEVAHAAVHQTRRTTRRNTRPHGRSWQTAFQQLMAPLLVEAVFPADVAQPLSRYMARPAATTAANPALMSALGRYDASSTAHPTDSITLLRDLPEGSTFQFAQKMYQRGTLRRTRVVCKELASGKSYAILAHVSVISEQPAANRE